VKWEPVITARRAPRVAAAAFNVKGTPMSPFLQLALLLGLMITAAKALGYLSLRLGQPSVLGELIAGLLLGPSVINILARPPFLDPHLKESVAHFAEIGVLMLMFIAGLDLHITDLMRSGRVAVYAGVMGVLLPLGMAYGVGMAFGLDPLGSLFLGLILAATSVSISAQTLLELRVLRSRVGVSLLGAAVLDDVLVVLGFSLFLAFTGEGHLGFGVGLLIVGRMLLYVVVAAGVGFLILPRLARAVDRLPISQGLMAFTIVTILLYAWAAEVIGHMAAITGAFLAGLFMAQSPLRDRVEGGLKAMAYGLFVPIFFVNVGLSADPRTMSPQEAWLIAALILVAVVSKVVGSGLGARAAGYSWREAAQLGVGMMSRGEVGLIVASLGIGEGFVSEKVFSGIVAVVLVTTLLTPPLLRALFRPQTREAKAAEATA